MARVSTSSASDSEGLRSASASGSGRWLLAVWLCGLPILGLLLGFDDWLRSHRPWFPNPLGSRVALVISGSANGAFLLPLLAVAALGFHRRGRGQTARTLTVLLLSGILAGLVGTTLRSIIGRTRPDVAVEQGWFGPRKDGRWLVGKYAYGSFPSGHVSLAAGVGFMAFAAGRRAGLAGSVYGVAVAWSRFHLGAHRASDAWAGLLVGGTITVLLWSPCLAWIRSRHRPRGWPRRWAFPGESRTPKPSWEH